MVTELIKEILKNVTEGYFTAQVITITVLAAAGLLCNLSLFGNFKNRVLMSALFAFPLGLALYSVSGLLLLLLGVPFNSVTAALFPFLITAALCIYGAKTGKYAGCFKTNKVFFIVFALTVVAAACLCTSGLLSVTIDNDSVYYYSTYPEIIAKEGRYLKYFDTFMTDVGQTSAVLNTLPFLYGFDETFGIQHFMNLNFIAVFAMGIYHMLSGKVSEAREEDKREGSDGFDRKAAVFSALATLFLCGSYPFIFISKWVMSNVYFMEYLCIILYLTLLSKSLKGTGSSLFIFTAMLSMLRVEGVVVCACLALCFSTLDIDSKTIALIYVLPVLILQGGFYIMLYLRMGVDPVYSFLDVKKALAITLGLLALLLYILLLRERLLKHGFIRERCRLLIILVLILGNAGFFVLNSERYIANALTIYRNIRLGHGWGYFGVFMLLAAALTVIDVVRGGFKQMAFPDFVWACFILTIIASCWARGGQLRMGVGDSGNRIMMETVPLTVAVLFKRIKLLQ